MRPTFDTLVAIFESHPNARYAQQITGMTPAQAAADLLAQMDKAPAQARDAMLAQALSSAGIFTDGHANFDRGSEQMLERLSRRDTRADLARQLSEASRSSPQYVAPERIRYVAEVMQKGRLQQGLADRFRRSDRDRARHEPESSVPIRESDTAWRDDQRDRRAALHAAVAATPDDHLERIGEHATLRDTLAAAFDAHEAIDVQRDPLEDQRLRDLSNAV